MPKIIELTVEICVQRVSCPGVWLCQDGRVSLTVFALGTSYQTCLLPPIFPLMFKDVFYFRKRFQETCALNNLCCLMKDETIYCELVQWSENCGPESCKILAQYLGSLNDVLFPPNMCWSDGVDLLMRRCKEFPGILSPKIEISTKVRIDEVWNHSNLSSAVKVSPCSCNTKPDDLARQKQVCHTRKYHRHKCSHQEPRVPRTPSKTRSRSSDSKSCCSFEDTRKGHRSPNRLGSRRPSPRPHSSRDYNVFSVETPPVGEAWSDAVHACPTAVEYYGDEKEYINESPIMPQEERLNKILLESRYIDTDDLVQEKASEICRKTKISTGVCVCEICKRYHELFHTDNDFS